MLPLARKGKKMKKDLLNGKRASKQEAPSQSTGTTDTWIPRRKILGQFKGIDTDWGKTRNCEGGGTHFFAFSLSGTRHQ